MPPPSPASGPRSITQSARAITCGLCSTTIRVCPRSANVSRTSSNFRVSAGWSPVVGSSSKKTLFALPAALVMAAGELDEETGELQALGLAAGEGRGRLAEPQIVEPHVHQGPEPRLDLPLLPEEAEGLARRQVEDLGDRLAPIGDLQGLGAIAGAPAFGTSHHDIGQELHVDDQEAVPLAGVAAAPLDVEAEAARPVVAGLGPPVAANALRISSNAFRYVTGFDRAERPIGDWSTRMTSSSPSQPVSSRTARPAGRSSPSLRSRAGYKRLLDQRALARPAHARHRAEEADREGDIDPLEVVAARPQEPRPAIAGGRRRAGTDATVLPER